MHMSSRLLRSAVFLAVIGFAGVSHAQNPDAALMPETAAKVAVVMDGKTGGILFDKK